MSLFQQQQIDIHTYVIVTATLSRKGIVGTIEEAQTIEYLENALQEIQKETRGLTGAPKFETWVQHASGTHRFDIMDNSELSTLLENQ